MVLGKPQTDPTLEWFLSHCHIHKYPSKSTLIHQGEKAETLYYIVKGSVAVLIKDEEGKEMILSYLNRAISSVNWACLKRARNVAPGFVQRQHVKWLKFLTRSSVS